MQKFLRRIISDYKEYFVLLILSVISLSVLKSNDSPKIKNLRIIGLGYFAVVNSAVTSLIDFFHTDSSFEELKQQNAELTLELNKLRKHGLENESLRRMLAFNDTSDFPLQPAEVISKLVTKTQGNYIINRGKLDSVKTGMPVINEKGLIGIVSEVADNFAVVKTLENSNLNIAVTIQRNDVDGILSWTGNRLIIKDIPTTYDIEVGDRIITSDFSSVFPPAIPVGVVVKKDSVQLGLLHNITVKPYVDPGSVSNVFIVMLTQSRQVNQLELNLMK